MPSKWLDWTPSRDELTEKKRALDPSKPSEPGFDGFEGHSPELFPITQDHEEVSQYEVNAIAKMGEPQPSKPSEPPNDSSLSLVPTTDGATPTSLMCPDMPKGVRLVRWEPIEAPVRLDVCSVVFDVPKFISSELRALDYRLNNPWTIHGGFTVPQMLDRLAQAGMEVELDPKGGVGEES
jgi:hypothetical protein